MLVVPLGLGFLVGSPAAPGQVAPAQVDRPHTVMVDVVYEGANDSFEEDLLLADVPEPAGVADAEVDPEREAGPVGDAPILPRSQEDDGGSAAAADGAAYVGAGALTEAQARAILQDAGFSGNLLEEALAVSYCESGWKPHNDNMGDQSDGLGSTGFFQLWSGWYAKAGESYANRSDPLVNARTALWVRMARGRWGGVGGWTCADLLGIY